MANDTSLQLPYKEGADAKSLQQAKFMCQGSFHVFISIRHCHQRILAEFSRTVNEAWSVKRPRSICHTSRQLLIEFSVEERRTVAYREFGRAAAGWFSEHA